VNVSRLVRCIAVLVIAAAIAATSCAHADRDYSTSWIGNSFGMGAGGAMMQYDVDGLYVTPDGTCFANTYNLDASRMWGVYKDDSNLGFIAGAAFGRFGGSPVTGNSKYVYIAQEENGGYANAQQMATGLFPKRGVCWYGIRRRQASAPWNPASFNGGLAYDNDFLEVGAKATDRAPGNVWGLAIDEHDRLYAADPLDMQILVYDGNTMQQIGGWPTSSPIHALVWDGKDQILWAASARPTGGNSIYGFNPSGHVVSGFACSGNPTALALRGDGSLFVADNGPDQDIKVYGHLSSRPAQVGELGDVGGVDAGTGEQIGKTGDWRFKGITGLGLDARDDLYVSENGQGPDLAENGGEGGRGFGATLECYNLATRACKWRVQSLEYVDCASLDPQAPDNAYGATAHYHLNYASTTPGSDWSDVGDTLNLSKYPQDSRLMDTDTAGVFTIDGHKFLTLGGGRNLDIYRFSPSTDGEVAIPCVSLISGAQHVPASQLQEGAFPPVGTLLWVDANGDGQYQQSEWSWSGGGSGPGSFGIDSRGDLWFSKGSALTELPCAGLSNGVPQYSWNTAQVLRLSDLPTPDPMKAVYKVLCDPASDRVYLTGYTFQHPPLGGEGAGGGVIEAFSHFGRSPQFLWESVLPENYTGRTGTSSKVMSYAIAGDYIFAQYETGYRTAIVRKSDGLLMSDTLTPDPAIVGAMNQIWVDQGHGISAAKLPSGEYAILVEDDIFTKNVMYRWRPPG
jgi:hypothetical protein